MDGWMDGTEKERDGWMDRLMDGSINGYRLKVEWMDG